ncbi:MAG: iron ABC transporter permease [Bacteroidales bacterium]
MGRLRNRSLFLLLLILLLLLFYLDLCVGSVSLGWRDVLAAFSGQLEDELGRRILFDFRLPRAVTAVVAGVALSAAGLQMQTLFRNPLAGPYVLGLSSGAGLGVALLVLGLPVIGWSATGMPSSISILLAASLGAGLVMLLMLLVSFRVRDVLTLLILGILLGSALSAVISILQYFTSESALRVFVVWTLGSLGGVSTTQLNVLVPSVILGSLLAMASVKMLNGLLLGEEEARSLGVNILLARVLVFLSTSLLAGAITAFCGPIGFIGVAVPHLARMLFGTSDHRILMPAAFLCGAVMMLLSDMISQLPGTGMLLPINAVTSLLGIPVIVWIIFRNSVSAKG